MCPHCFNTAGINFAAFLGPMQICSICNSCKTTDLRIINSIDELKIITREHGKKRYPR